MIRGLAVCVTVAVLSLGALPPAGAGGGPGRPGVTKTEIRVGGVATVRGAAGRDYKSAFAGVKAYFAAANQEGGVFGRRLRLVTRLDDGGGASRNIAENRKLAANGRVFAVLPESTRLFAGADQAVATGIPTFGWNTGLEWARGPNLFGDTGSYRCFSCPAVAPAFVAAQLGAKRVAVLAPASRQDVDCGHGLRDGLERYGFDVQVADTGVDEKLSGLNNDVQQLKQRNVQLVATCRLGLADLKRVKRAMDDADLSSVPVYAEDVYDPAAVKRAGSKLDGLIVGLRFVPWEEPSSSPGTSAFLVAMKKAKRRPTPAAQAGWINAALLVAGIKAAGSDFTQESVVAAINAMTDFRADGILPGINWTLGGHGPSRERCTAYVRATNGRFALRFAEAAQPFVCFPDNPVPGQLNAPVFRPAPAPSG